MPTYVPSDLYLINLYREFSQECWFSPWIGNPEKDVALQNQFTTWIIERTKRKPLEPRDFENDALPILRFCFKEATNTLMLSQSEVQL